MAGQIAIRFRLPSRQDLEAASRKAIEAAAIKAVSLIKQRTSKGMGADGTPFKPYSRAYAKAKAGAGRNVATPDLRLTGQMLRNLKVLQIAGPRLAYIGFEGVHRVSRIEDAKGKGTKLRDGTRATTRVRRTKATVPMATIVRKNNRIRPFFDIRTKAEKDAIREVYRRTLVDLTRRATNR